MKKQKVTSKTTSKQTAKATVNSALIESLVRQDLASIGSSQPQSCAISICKF